MQVYNLEQRLTSHHFWIKIFKTFSVDSLLKQNKQKANKQKKQFEMVSFHQVSVSAES